MTFRSAADGAAPPSGMLTLLLCVAVTIAGGCVMVIELVGTRVLAPVFGSSLYVWTSQISVALLSLTLGYPLGGWLADRYPRPRVFFLSMVAAGLAVILCMLLRGSVLHVAMNWEARIGIVASSLALFTLPLMLMGMVGPFAARLFIRDMTRIGVTIGKLSALSAFGSIFGSFATGFLLIPHVSINATLWTVAGVMIGMGLIGLLIAGEFQSGGRAAIASAVGVAIGLWNPLRHDVALAQGAKVLFEGSSAYGDIKVIDLPLARLMYIGQMIQTIDSRGGALPEGHRTTLHDVAHFIPAFRPNAKKALLIGLAGGTKVKMLNAHGIAVDSIEIDPMVVAKAKEFFGIVENEQSRIFIEDGRPFINRCTTQYDVVIMDVFGGGVAPSHLFSTEALTAMKRCLAPGGLMMMNCVRVVADPNDQMIADVLKTIDATALFSHRRTFEWDPAGGGEIRNYLTFASDKPLDFGRPLTEVVPADILQELQSKSREVTIDVSRARVITDDLNPLDVLQIGHNEGLRKVALSPENPLRSLFDPQR